MTYNYIKNNVLNQKCNIKIIVFANNLILMYNLQITTNILF